MSDHRQTIQRLWYTAPSSRRSTDSGERFRICAVTTGLNQDIYEGGAQVRVLDYYARYAPPDGTARNDASVSGETPDLDGRIASDSPLCLSLIDIASHPDVLASETLAEKLRGRVLVNKIYLGKVGDGREGNFFIDLLSHLPEDFSARTALALWRSDFWQREYISDNEAIRLPLGPPELALPVDIQQELADYRARRLSIPPAVPATLLSVQQPVLRNPFAKLPLEPHTRKALREMLTFLIHAYLLQQDEEWIEKSKKQQELTRLKGEIMSLNAKKQYGITGKIRAKEQEYLKVSDTAKRQRFKQIFLAGEDDRLAYCLTLLAHLLRDIPFLLQPLTFSTYEYNVLQSECLVVGTVPSRAGAADRQILMNLLPSECQTRGFVYNSYEPDNKSILAQQVPYYKKPYQIDQLPIERVARDLASKLVKSIEGTNGRFERDLYEVASRIRGQDVLSPALQLVSLWRDKLGTDGLFENRHLHRAEAERLFRDPEWRKFLEESEIILKVSQWVVADDMGFDLDQPVMGQALPYLWKPDMAGKWLSQTFFPLVEQVRRDNPDLCQTFLIPEIVVLLEKYADNLAPSFVLFPPDTRHEEHSSSLASPKIPPVDILEAYRPGRDPQPFKALLEMLTYCEPPVRSAPAWRQLLEYLLSPHTIDNRPGFWHGEASSFILRHIYRSDLPDRAKELHWRIHARLLIYCNQVLPESLPEEYTGKQQEPSVLVDPLLRIPLECYFYLFGNNLRQIGHRSWRKNALGYQLEMLNQGTTIHRFTGQFWEDHQMTSDETSANLALLHHFWQTHLLLITEALACLDEWADADTLVEEAIPPLQKEVIQELEKAVKELQRVIEKQTHTRETDNIVVIAHFYIKLIRDGYPENNTLSLLKTWHDVWRRGDFTTEALREIVLRTTNLSHRSLGDLLKEHKEEYKARKADDIIIDLYERYVQQGNEELWKKKLFEVLDGSPVSPSTLDELLKLSQFSSEVKVEFFVRFGPVYLKEYFARKSQERSKELLLLFFKLIDEQQKTTQQLKLKPGQALLERKVIEALLWLWLSAVDLDEGGTIKSLIQRAKLETLEMVSILATFGSQYMSARHETLTTLCQELFEKICADALIPAATRLQVYLMLWPPDLFPFMGNSLSLSDAFKLFQTANLASERLPALLPDLSSTIFDQTTMAHRQADVLIHFLDKHQCNTDGLFEKLQPFLTRYDQGARELANTLEAFLQQQGNYFPSELELFLEIQEYRSQSVRPENLAPPLATYLYYLDASPKEDEARSFGKLYRLYLKDLQLKNFDRRPVTVSLLALLSETPEAYNKHIHGLSQGLLDTREFLELCKRIADRQQQRRLVRQETSIEDDPVLSADEIDKLGASLQVIWDEDFSSTGYDLLRGELVEAIVPCISASFDVARLLRLGSPLYPQEDEAKFRLFEELSQRASASAHKPLAEEGNNSEWFLPYLELLPDLKAEAGLKKQIREHQYRILNILIYVNNQPDKATVQAIESYLQREPERKSSQEIATLWNKYKAAQPDVNALLQKEEPGETAARKGTDAAPNLFIILVQGFRYVFRMRNAIDKADRAEMYALWENLESRHVLSGHLRQVGSDRWKRFQAISRLDRAYRAWQASGSRGSNAQQLERSFTQAIEQCRNLEKDQGSRKTCITEEQQKSYEQIHPPSQEELAARSKTQKNK